MSINRRQLLTTAFAAPLLANQIAKANVAADTLLDIHVHLFGVGEGGTGCRMAKSITEGLQFRLLVSSLALRQKAALAREGKSSTDVNCIFIWSLGGVSHHDTLDPKPESPESSARQRSTSSALACR